MQIINEGFFKIKRVSKLLSVNEVFSINLININNSLSKNGNIKVIKLKGYTIKDIYGT